MVVPIFSRGAAGPTHVRLIRGAGGIKRDSVLFCEELTTLDRDFLTHGPLGAPVDAHVLVAVIRAVRAKVSEAERLRRERQQKATSRPIGEETAQEAERRRWREARDASARRRFGR